QEPHPTAPACGSGSSDSDWPKEKARSPRSEPRHTGTSRRADVRDSARLASRTKDMSPVYPRFAKSPEPVESQLRDRSEDPRDASRAPRGLVLAFPVVEIRARAREEDAFAFDAARADLARVEALDGVGRDQRREHEDANRSLGVVAHLMRAFLAPRKADDVTLAELLLSLRGPKRRRAAQHDHPFLVRVMRVVRP